MVVVVPYYIITKSGIGPLLDVLHQCECIHRVSV